MLNSTSTRVARWVRGEYTALTCIAYVWLSLRKQLLVDESTPFSTFLILMTYSILFPFRMYTYRSSTYVRVLHTYRRIVSNSNACGSSCTRVSSFEDAVFKFYTRWFLYSFDMDFKITSHTHTRLLPTSPAKSK